MAPGAAVALWSCGFASRSSLIKNVPGEDRGEGFLQGKADETGSPEPPHLESSLLVSAWPRPTRNRGVTGPALLGKASWGAGVAGMLALVSEWGPVAPRSPVTVLLYQSLGTACKSQFSSTQEFCKPVFKQLVA